MTVDRSPGTEDQDDVSTVELFFDLVFIFALTQITHHFLGHLTWRGVAESAVMLAAVFGTWAYTSFDATLTRVGRSFTTPMLLAVMLLGLFMNASISNAFDTEPWAFAVPYLVIQLGRPIWAFATATEAVFRNYYLRVIYWVLATAPPWLFGAFVDSEFRLAFWAVAAVVDTAGTWFGHPIPGKRLRSVNVEFDAAHLIERCRLFLLIALGETVLATGYSLAETTMSPMTVLTGTSALVAIIALWALYFAGSEHLVNRHAETTNDPIHAGRMTLRSEVFVVAGLVALAVGNEYVITHPHDPGSIAISLILFGGPIIYVVAQTSILYAVSARLSRARTVGVGVLLVAALGAVAVPLWASLLAVAVVLVGVAIASLKETRSPL